MSSTSNAVTPALLVATFTTGVIDAVGVLGLGRVFTANMTGNVVFLGFALAGVPGYSMARAGIALVAFLAGAVLDGLLARTFASARPQRWLGAVITMLAGAAVGALLVLANGIVVPLAASSALSFIAAGLYFTQPSIGAEV